MPEHYKLEALVIMAARQGAKSHVTKEAKPMAVLSLDLFSEN